MTANMLFLANFDGDTTYEDGGAGGTFTTATGITYDDGYLAGKQGVVVDGSDVLKITGTSAALQALVPSTTGSVMVRFRPDTTVGANAQEILYVGNNVVGADSERITIHTDSRIRAMNVPNFQLSELYSTGAVSVGTHYWVYMGWDGTNWELQFEDEALKTATRATPFATYGASGGICVGFRLNGDRQLGGLVDCVAAYDGLLTAGERTAARTRLTPWTWQMDLVNDPPVVDAGADSTATTGTAWTSSASFTDTDSASWTATADYGEGAGPVAATVNQSAKTVALSHTYTTAGTYTVTVNVTDDGGLIGSDTVQVTVTEGPTLGAFVVLSVPGTDTSAPVIVLS
jgi:hypothetical protein